MHEAPYITVLLILCELKYQWKTKMLWIFLRHTQLDEAFPLPYANLHLQYFHLCCFPLEWKYLYSFAKANTQTSILHSFSSALNHPSFVVEFLLLVWFCLTEIYELPSVFSCCINEGWTLPGHQEQKAGMFPDELGSLALAHSNHCWNHPSSSLADCLIATWGSMAMSLMSRPDYPGWLEL